MSNVYGLLPLEQDVCGMDARCDYEATDGQIDFHRNHLWTPTLELDTIKHRHFGLILPKLRALLPAVKYEQEINAPSLSADDLPFSQAYLRLVLTSLSNGLAGLEQLPAANILSYLQFRFNGTRLLNFVESLDKSVCASFAESLLECAIRASKPDVVDFLLSKKLFMLDVNRYINFKKGEAIPLVFYTTGCWDAAVTKILLRHGANVGIEYQYRRDILDYLFRSRHQNLEHHSEEQFLELAHMLLRAGAPPTQVLERVIRSKITKELSELCELVITSYGGTLHEQWRLSGKIRDLILRLDPEASMRIVRTLIEEGIRFSEDAKSTPCTPLDFPCASTIDAAAKTGNLALLRLLQEHGAKCTRTTFACAVASGHCDLVRFLCNETITVGWENRFEDADDVEAAIAEGIHEDGPEMLKLLQKHHRIAHEYQKPISYAILLDAAQIGDIEQLGSLLNSQALLQTPVAETSLPWRVYKNLLGYLLQNSSDAGHEEIVSKLLHASLRKFDVSPAGHEALALALKHRNKRLVRMLIDAGLASYSYLADTLKLALEWGERDIVLHILHTDACYHEYRSPDLGSWPKEAICTALCRAIKVRDKAMIVALSKIFTNKYSMPEEYSSIAMAAAIETRDHAMLEFLLDRGYNLSSSYPLLEAMDYNIVRLFEFICEYDRRFLGHGTKLMNTALQHLIWRQDMESLRGLLELFKHRGNGQFLAKDDIEDIPLQLTFDTPLATAITATKSIRLEATTMLLEYGADPNRIISSEDSYETWRVNGDRGIHITPLLQAIRNDDIDMVKFLIMVGADVNRAAKRNIRRTPLQQAAEQGNFEITQTLLQNGADANNDSGVRIGATALQFAAKGGYVGIVELLMNYGANPNAPGSFEDKRTGLEAAAEHGRLDVVQLLLHRGIVQRQKRWSSEPDEIRLAEMNGHYAVADLLRSWFHGPRVSEVDELFDLDHQFAGAIETPQEEAEETSCLASQMDTEQTNEIRISSDEDSPAHPVTEHTCPQCRLKLYNASALRRHIRTKHSDEAPYPCNICSQRFKRKDMLQRHFAVHCNIGKVPCPTCGKFFRRDYFHSTHLTADGECKNPTANEVGQAEGSSKRRRVG